MFPKRTSCIDTEYGKHLEVGTKSIKLIKATTLPNYENSEPD